MLLRNSWDYIIRTSEARLRNNKTKFHKDIENIELIGAAGELAAQRFLGIKESLHTGFDGGIDFYWRGWSVDVKATRLHENLHKLYLQYPADKKIKSDIIFMVGVCVDAMEATEIGWTSGNIMRKAEVNQERRWPCREIPVTDLAPPWGMFILREKSSLPHQSRNAYLISRLSSMYGNSETNTAWLVA